MNFNILYEFRLDSVFSYILSIILIFYIFKNTPIPNNLNLNSNIKKIYFWISVIFISIIIFLFFNTINVIIFIKKKKGRKKYKLKKREKIERIKRIKK